MPFKVASTGHFFRLEDFFLRQDSLSTSTQIIFPTMTDRPKRTTAKPVAYMLPKPMRRLPRSAAQTTRDKAVQQPRASNGSFIKSKPTSPASAPSLKRSMSPTLEPSRSPSPSPKRCRFESVPSPTAGKRCCLFFFFFVWLLSPQQPHTTSCCRPSRA
jgi:hypothetical protein